MVGLYILPRSELGSNDHREDAPHFMCKTHNNYFLDIIEILEKPIYLVDYDQYRNKLLILDANSLLSVFDTNNQELLFQVSDSP